MLSSRHDLTTKRRDYAMAGIAQYWIVDQEKETMTVLTLDGGDREYVESAVVRPGQRWRTDQPFPLTFDLGEVF